MTDLRQPLHEHLARGIASSTHSAADWPPPKLIDDLPLQQILLSDASEQAAMLLSRTAALTSELALQSYAEAYHVEHTARECAERIIADAKEERERLLVSARQRANQIEVEVSRTLSDLQYLDAVRSGQFAEQLDSERAAHLAEFAEFLTRAAAELARLRSTVASDLAAHTEPAVGGPAPSGH